MLRIGIASLWFVMSMGAVAAPISYYGYSLDTSTNIVTGGGLQWLQWDQTVGQSINTALANYGDAGWRLATNDEVAALYNAFDFGKHFSADENLRQDVDLYDDDYSFGVANEFIALFGDTFAAAGLEYGNGDKDEKSSAWFGADFDEDGLFNWAIVQDEYTVLDTRGRIVHFPGYAFLREDDKSPDTVIREVGVALVRVVPLPATSWLCVSALLLLGLSMRQRRNQ